jgi:hypothetical protein
MQNHPMPEETDNKNHQYHHRKELRKEQLVNKLNYINFQDGTICLKFRHLKYNQVLVLKAKPQPCIGDELVCIWPESENVETGRLSAYSFSEVNVTNGKNMLVFKPDDIRISENEVRFTLPETCLEIDRRRLRRYPCEGINAWLIQNSISFEGRLVNFSADSFKVKLSESPSQRFFWINPDFQATLILSDGENILYAGECRILEHTTGRSFRNYILEPFNDPGRRLKPKDFRSIRQQLIPSPCVSFTHPLIKKFLKLTISDLSGSGFSVEIRKDNAFLMPGMIFPVIQLSFEDVFRTNCKAQVIYRSAHLETGNQDFVRCGFAILDMDIQDHAKLLSLLYRAKDSKSFFCTQVDQDELWSFFFESGFIYPKKYAYIEENKGKIKSTYEKIYGEPIKIARHFVYRDNGRILGHMSMLRFYLNTWMIQHYAANTTFSKTAGIDVLDQIGRFIHETHRIFSSQMDYVFCYYRPENKFPSRVFGGITDSIADPKMCSLDSFAYFYYKKPYNVRKIREPWCFEKVRKEDLFELVYEYESRSGGLMLNALEILPDSEQMNDLVSEYNRLGFKREKHLFAIKHGTVTKAIALINIADIGLNLSNLTNGIHLFVIDPLGFSNQELNSVLAELSSFFHNNSMPVLLYPTLYADENEIRYEKKYTLWVVEVEHSDPYFIYLKKYIRRISQLQSRGIDATHDDLAQRS